MRVSTVRAMLQAAQDQMAELEEPWTSNLDALREDSTETLSPKEVKMDSAVDKMVSAKLAVYKSLSMAIQAIGKTVYLQWFNEERKPFLDCWDFKTQDGFEKADSPETGSARAENDRKSHPDLFDLSGNDIMVFKRT